MEIREYKVYKFDELTEDAKQKAIENYRDINTDHEWYDITLDDWKTRLAKYGFDDAEISFSGFWSQGDGASFTAKIDLAKWIKSHHLGNSYRAVLTVADEISGAVVRIDHHYSHENTVRATLENYSDKDSTEFGKKLDELEHEIDQDVKHYSNLIYRELEKEYNFLTSDEQIIETFRANDYDFTEAGRID